MTLSALKMVVTGVLGGSASRRKRWQIHIPSPQDVQVGAGVTAHWIEGFQD